MLKKEYYLQNRWKLEDNKLYYYGMRNRDDLFKNSVSLNKKQADIISTLPKALDEKELKTLSSFMGVQIVAKEDLKITPSSIDEAVFCKTCSANDFIIPGLEFDENGQCPMCQTQKETQSLKSILPMLDDIPVSTKSRFDVAVFYTGGKDSTFLLYQLAKVRKLRVLALTWEIPFMSDSAKRSIDNAKKHFDNVEFISRSVSSDDLKKIYKKLYSTSGNLCACPSLAYLLFYPELVANRVPYFVAGNEPVQMLGLYYNHMAPKIAYRFHNIKSLNFLVNLGRVLTLRPPLKKGQLHTLLTMKQLAFGDNPLKKLSGYTNPLVSNVVEAIKEVPSMLLPLKKAVRVSSRKGTIPGFVHLDFDKLCGGKYDWNKVKDVLVNECGWVPPDDRNKALHTSCKIEKCKDHSQFIRFYNCESRMIPFSAIEISLASRNCGKTREELLYEMKNLLGFTLEAPKECLIMKEYLK